MTPIDGVIQETNQALGQLGLKERLPKASDGFRYSFASLIADALDGTTYSLRVAEGDVGIHHAVDGVPMFFARMRFLHDIDGAITLRAHEHKKIAFDWLLPSQEIRRILKLPEL